MNVKFYGTRGSSPIEGNGFRRFGGATSCCLLTSAGTQIIIDAGSGLTTALQDIDRGNDLYLLLTHLHLDHIAGLVMLLTADIKAKVHIFGKTRDGKNIKELISGIIRPPYWPITPDGIGNILFHDVPQGVFELGSLKAEAMESNHPNGGLVYRIYSMYCHRSVTFAFDFNHGQGYGDRLAAFAKGSNLLIYDGNMSEEEYKTHSDWGHSTPYEGIKIAKKTGSYLIVTHHSVSANDNELEEREEDVRREYPDSVFASDGMLVENVGKNMKIISASMRERDVLGCLLDVGMLLSSEKDADILLEKIIKAAMYITGADGGTLYTIDGNALHFRIMITKSKNFYKGGKGNPIDLPPVPLRPENVCAAAVLERKLINIVDAYDNNRYDFSGPKKYDAINGYKTTSILVVPMVNDKDDVIGVMQLINSTDLDGNVVPFPVENEKILSSIASQAAISITNMNYSAQIVGLLNDFVKVMSSGIDARSPYNANHTKNMVKYGERFFEYERSINGKWAADSRTEKEIIMSIWLHDIGKLITPLEIMDKNTRLGNKLEPLISKLRRRSLLNRLEYAEGKLSEADFKARRAEFESDIELVLEANKASVLSDSMQAGIDALKTKSFTDDDGTVAQCLTEEEYHCLSIKKGTLTAEERKIMMDHVSLTSGMLSKMNFPKDYADVPFWAGAHHEFLNGKGYPNGLSADQIPWQVRLITIIDIFEALTSRDRPYKSVMPVDEAFKLMKEMVGEGRIDGEITEEFERSKVWEIK